MNQIKDIVADIKNGNIQPIYFLTGEEPYYIDKISNFIEKIITNKNKERIIYNIAGNKKKSLWDLFQEMADYKNKKVLKINFKIFDKVLPNIFKNFLIKNEQKS